MMKETYPSGQVHLAPLQSSFDLCKKERYEKTADGRRDGAGIVGV